MNNRFFPALCALVLLAGPGAASFAAETVAAVRVLPSETPIRTGVFVERDEWFQLIPTGTWQAFSGLSRVDYHGHTNLTITGKPGPFGALMYRVGGAEAQPLRDTLPIKAESAGEISLWCNLEGVALAGAAGFLDVQVRKGVDLAEVAQMAAREKQERIDALAADTEAQSCLRRLNETRTWAGLAPVRLSVDRSAGCARHAEYLAANWGRPEVEGLKAHEEVESLRGFTPEGKRAGVSSDINYVSPTASIASWIATFYHRVPLLHPDLVEIGIGYTRGGPGWVSVLDCAGARDRSPKGSRVRYPAPGQAGVPVAFQVEIPSPLPPDHAGPAGFPVTVSFYQHEKVLNARLDLSDSAGRAVDGYLSSPEHPAASFPQGGTICFIPQQTLAWGERYTAHVTASIDGSPFDDTWSFTTAAFGSAGPGQAGPEAGAMTVLGGVLIGGLIGILLYVILGLFLF